jgi:hypothetical protein
MPHDHESRPEQRHADLEQLNETINRGKNAVLSALMGMILLGIGTLISNHYQTKALTEKVGAMTAEMKEMRNDQVFEARRIAIMWSGGGWETKYRTEHDRK